MRPRKSSLSRDEVDSGPTTSGRQAGIQTDRDRYNSPLAYVADASNQAAGSTSRRQLGCAMLGRPVTMGQCRVRVESSRVVSNQAKSPVSSCV